MLQGKNIILGVCGSIAAYKTATLIRLLVKEQANVQVLMTEDAKNFISPLTLSTLSGKPVLSQYFDAETGAWNEHVQLALWADLILIAPASANTLAKFAHGLCDNLLSAVYLSSRCPVYLAPAMDLDMWAHQSTQDNLLRLQGFGNLVIPPGEGELASGLVGKGRMAEPEEMLKVIHSAVKGSEKSTPLHGKKALVTAGPTHEAIDPVRFIGNHSSGKMGYALAEVLRDLGAEVTLISGPSALAIPAGMRFISVTSSQEMLNECLNAFPAMDIAVMNAAVADYRPSIVANEKIKKEESTLNIKLEKTTDILATLGTKKTSGQLLVGFALETQDELVHAKGKLVRKNLDFIVLNSLRDKGAGFAGDQNKVTLLMKGGEVIPFDLKPKLDVAMDICQKIIEILPR